MGTKKSKASVNPIRVGNKVLIRTVTLYHTGKIVEITKEEIVLVDAAWIADTGRLNAALTASTAGEVEPFPDPVAVGRGSIVDVTNWRGELPRTVK